MASALGLLQLVMLATACFAAGIACAAALAYPILRPRLRGLPPAQCAVALRWICAAPIVGAIVLTAICLLPSLLAVVWPHFDHCPTHDGHVHLCVVHLPASLGAPWGWAVGGMFWGLVTAAFLAATRRARGAATSLKTLWIAARYEPDLGAHLVESSLPFCAVVGWTRQRVLFSTALAAVLPASLLRVVLAHETRHVRRRDSLWQLVASLSSVAHLPALRRRLLCDLALAAERACDEHAACAVGDRLEVARAILFVERMLTERAGVHALAPGFGGSDVRVRVEALVDPPRTESAWGPAVIGFTIITALLAGTASTTIHHWTETLLGLVVH